MTIDAGGPFPERDEILFLSFSVILATLILQGLTLPPLIHFLDVDDADEQLDREESKARLLAEARSSAWTSLRPRTGCARTPSSGFEGGYEYRRRRFASLRRRGGLRRVRGALRATSAWSAR